MTEQMAVEKLRFLPTPMFDNEADEAKRMAIKAIEKQIPKKPIPIYGISNSIHSYSCPACENAYLGGGEYRYDCCEDCGQKLDWSDEDELE